MNKDLLELGLGIILVGLVLGGLLGMMVHMDKSYEPKEVKCYDRYRSEIVGETCISTLDLGLELLIFALLFILEVLMIVCFFSGLVSIISRDSKQEGNDGT